MECPNHGGAFDCTPFCELCEGKQETINRQYAELEKHLGHEITLAKYGDKNLSLECETCFEVLTDYEKENENE